MPVGDGCLQCMVGHRVHFGHRPNLETWELFVVYATTTDKGRLEVKEFLLECRTNPLAVAVLPFVPSDCSVSWVYGVRVGKRMAPRRRAEMKRDFDKEPGPKDPRVPTGSFPVIGESGAWEKRYLFRHQPGDYDQPALEEGIFRRDEGHQDST